MLEIGERKFIQIPGDKHHQLPPLLVRTAGRLEGAESVFGQAAAIVDSEELIPDTIQAVAPPEDLERRRLDLAFTLIDRYQSFLGLWLWGDSVLEWIRQCEITFETLPDLRFLVSGEVWPRAGRASLVTLLSDKHVEPREAPLDRAVGLRLTFRQPPPIGCFSEQFLLYLNGSVAESAYRAWVSLASQPAASLPPERFDFQVHVM